MKKYIALLLTCLLLCAPLCSALAETPEEPLGTTESVTYAEDPEVYAQPVEEVLPGAEDDGFALGGDECDLSELEADIADDVWTYDAADEFYPPDQVPMDSPSDYCEKYGHDFGYIETDDGTIPTGICDKCGYVCPHPDKSCVQFIHEYKTYQNTNDDTVHIRKYELICETTCMACDMDIKEELLDSGEEEEAHNFISQDNCWRYGAEETKNGVATCLDCGYQRKAECAHANTYAVHPTDPYEWSEVTTGESVGQQGHMVTGYCDETIFCSDCGAKLETRKNVGPVTDICEHDFEWSGGVCKCCGFVNTCPHPAEYLVGSSEAAFTVYEPIDDNYHQKTFCATNYVRCELCGEYWDDYEEDVNKVLPQYSRVRKEKHRLTSNGVCKDCGYFAHIHTPVTDAAVAPTCTAAGRTEGSHCATCNAVLVEQQPIPATGHNPVTDPAVAATCISNGLTEGSHCAVCGAVLVAQQPIPATGHSPVTDPAVAPTYTTAGVTEGSHCAVCGTVLAAQQPVPELGYPQIALGKVKNNGTVTLAVGEIRQIAPAFATASGWTVNGYKSNKPAVASVDGSGLLTAKAEGKAKITVTTAQKKSATVTVKVVDPYKPTAISIAQGKSVQVTMGQPLQLNAVLAPESARATLTWASSKKKVATVDGNGLVTPVGEGTTKITVRTQNKKKATVTVKVVDPYKPTAISIAQGKTVTMKVGQTLQLGVNLNPATAQSALTWKTNKPAIATVDANGVVTAVKKGKAKITVTTYNKKKATITVNVVP